MKFSEYRLLNLRTNKWLTSLKMDLAHALIGMTSEINELEDAIKKGDEINITEELADIMWYLSLYLTVRNIPTPELNLAVNYSSFENLVRNISILNDLAKKWIIYNKDINEVEEIGVLAEILTTAHNFFLNSNTNRVVNIERGLQNNIDKLKKRYPEKYSDELAQNRDLVAERKELEK